MVASAILSRLPVLFLAFLPFLSVAQDTDRLSPDFHASRRSAFRREMSDSTIAIFFTNPVRNRSNSVDFQYSQDPDFYYLTGITEPDAALVLFKSPFNFRGNPTSEILFVEGPNKESATWSGPVLTPQQAIDSLHFQLCLTNAEFENSIGQIVCSNSLCWVSWPDQPRKWSYSAIGQVRIVQSVKEALARCGITEETKAAKDITAQLREVKTPEELVLMKKAIALTVNGFMEMIRAVEPGMKEYQAQAIVEYVSKKGGSEYQGYPSIAGQGANACVLHYTFNRAELKAGDLLLADMGAEYHGYTADITRTIPVNGRFSEHQRILYDLVFQAQEAGIEACRPGNRFRASHEAAMEVIARGLKKLGIIKEEADAKRYFMHGTSHYLGLDVHDAGTFGCLKPGTVLTVEPGIYIREGSPCDPKWWNTGIRIEDDILVTETGPVLLSAGLPRTAAAIESFMLEK